MSILDAVNLISRATGKELTAASAHFVVDKFDGNKTVVHYYTHSLDGAREEVIGFKNILHFWLNASYLLYWLPTFALCSQGDKSREDGFIKYISSIAFQDNEEYFNIGMGIVKEYVDLSKLGSDPHMDFTVNKDDKSLWAFGYDIPKLSDTFYYNLYFFNFLVKFFCDAYKFGRPWMTMGMKTLLSVLKNKNLNIYDVGQGMTAAAIASDSILEIMMKSTES